MADTEREPEFRPVSPAHYDTFRRCADYAFHPEDGPQDHDDEFDRIADPFGVFDGEELLSICAHYDFEARLRGEWVPLAGLAAVATPPEHRRRGLVRRMVEASLDRWRGDSPLAALWPFERAYYEQFGWATANTVCEYTVPLDELAFARGTATGRVRPVDPDGWAALDGAYEAATDGQTLALRRDERWWRDRVFESIGGEERYVYAWERDGAVRGHVACTFESTGDALGDRHIEVGDVAFADDDALVGLLGFLADHDSQANDATLVTADETLLDRVRSPDAVDCEVHTGPMVRVVDVERALSAVSYPADATAEVTLRVTDATAPWNDGVFDLAVAAGDGRCESAADPTVDADPERDADLTVDVGTLSQLVVGYHDVATARRVGDLTVADEAVAQRLAALFPPETVYLRDFF